MYCYDDFNIEFMSLYEFYHISSSTLRSGVFRKVTLVIPYQPPGANLSPTTSEIDLIFQILNGTGGITPPSAILGLSLGITPANINLGASQYVLSAAAGLSSIRFGIIFHPTLLPV